MAQIKMSLSAYREVASMYANDPHTVTCAYMDGISPQKYAAMMIRRLLDRESAK